MDRFIDTDIENIETQQNDLKSNMDRFIVQSAFSVFPASIYLKSNMDRFIDIFWALSVS